MIKPLSILCLSIALTGCGFFSAYKTPIQQGRIISQKQIFQVKPGMTMAQIQFILGTPGVKDPFHTNTWNYVYIYKLGGQAQTLKKLTLTFKGGKLTSLSGDYIPPTALKYQYSNTPVTAATVTKKTTAHSLSSSKSGPSLKSLSSSRMRGSHSAGLSQTKTDPRLREDDTKTKSSSEPTSTKNKTTARHPDAAKQPSGSTPAKNKGLWELS